MEYLNLILSFTHPNLYNAGLKSLIKFHHLPATAKYAKIWPTVFHGISVISNRVSKPHIDFSGSWAWYDQILSIGTYTQATLTLGDFDAKFEYKPGTVVHFCGNLLTHEVGSWDHGDRVCYASLVKKSIFDGLGIDLPDWCYLDDVKKAVLDTDHK